MLSYMKLFFDIIIHYWKENGSSLVSQQTDFQGIQDARKIDNEDQMLFSHRVVATIIVACFLLLCGLCTLIGIDHWESKLVMQIMICLMLLACMYVYTRNGLVPEPGEQQDPVQRLYRQFLFGAAIGTASMNTILLERQWKWEILLAVLPLVIQLFALFLLFLKISQKGYEKYTKADKEEENRESSGY